MTFQAQTDRLLVRASANSVRYVRIHFAAPAAPPRAKKTERRPLDLALVIDCSGSMVGEKLQLAKDAARQAIQLLTTRDRVALIAYGSEVLRLAPAAPLTAAHRKRLLNAVDGITTMGCTNLSGGWLTGCEEVATEMRANSIARCLLLSDGLANEGITDVSALCEHATALRARGVMTSTFGIGDDFDERLMEGMARAGGGNFYYVRDAEQIPQFLTAELGEALEVVARNVELVVDADAGLEVSSLDGRRISSGGTHTRIGLDDVVARQETELVLRVRFPKMKRNQVTGIRVRLEDADGVLAEEPVAVSWTAAGHEANDGQPRELVVDRAVATRYAASARREATEYNRAGDLTSARSAVRGTADRIREYADGDAVIMAVVAELESREMEHERVWDASALKDESMATYSVMESKQATGMRRRRG